MQRIILPDETAFSLDQSLRCGQVFRWEKTGDWWEGVVEREAIRIRQQGRRLTFEGTTPERVRDYFQLDLDLAPILRSIDRDSVIRGAIAACCGLRLIKQSPWECLASYICATYANIPGIKKKIALLAENFGDPISHRSGRDRYAFPPVERIAGSDLCDISACRLGYRAPYLCATAQAISRDPGWIRRVDTLDYANARRDLMCLAGVGPKVADCVLLFAFQKYEAFPVDVWIARIMQRFYGAPVKGNYEQTGSLGRRYFGPYAGYAQEYLFIDRERILSLKEAV
jgi:N-glycosylase/DNA lyase